MGNRQEGQSQEPAPEQHRTPASCRRSSLGPHAAPVGPEDFKSISIVDDRIGWYLYLAETFLDGPLSYEPIQVAHVLPIFAQLGSHVELLDGIGGIREKCLEIINPERRNPDAGLFEILTALMYARDDWPTVNHTALFTTALRHLTLNVINILVTVTTSHLEFAFLASWPR